MNNIFKSSLYPLRCLSCDEVLDFGMYRFGFCRNCAKEIRFAYEPVCKICGKVIEDENGELCSDCKKKKHYFTQSKGVYVYEGGIKAMMYRFKYGNRRCYRYIFARDIIRLHGAWIKAHKIEAIVPVPMYKRKKRLRGYNQAEVIASRLSKEIGIPMYPDMVCRNRPTVPMKGLNDIQRQKNLKNAFNFNKKGLLLERVLIIDDIYTTGTTLDEVAKALLDGGVREVYGLCLCVGRGYS